MGLLQGAQIRANCFAGLNELRQLQNELRAGLRELDAVKAEIAIAASSRGTIGRQLGATVASANRPPSGDDDSSIKDYAAGSLTTSSRSLRRGTSRYCTR